jgi:hypothetical protein
MRWKKPHLRADLQPQVQVVAERRRANRHELRRANPQSQVQVAAKLEVQAAAE